MQYEGVVMAIRWRKNDVRELQNYVRKFNAKITRTEKKNPAAKEFLPQRLNVRDLQEGITERKDFNNLKRSVDRFMKKGAENITQLANGVTTTKWQKEEWNIQRATINRRRAESARKAKEAPSGRMGKVEQYANKPLPEPENIKPGDWQRYVERLEKQAKEAYIIGRREQYLANWVQGLFTEFGDEAAMEILKATEGIDRKKLIDAIIDNDALSLGFVYSLVELEDRKERLLAELALL